MSKDDYRQTLGYPHRITHGRTVCYFRDLPDAPVMAGMQAWLSQPLQTRVSAEQVPGDGLSLFGKRVRVGKLSKRIRSTRGLPKRDGTYDWLVEEMINTAEANVRGARVPELVGYGYTRSSLGLVTEQFLVTRMLQGYVDGAQWLRTHPGSVHELIATLFAMLKALYDKGISHMDLWAGNLMIADDPSEPAMVIDLENCFTTPPQHLPELLALQMSLPYRCSLYAYITEADYDRLVYETLWTYGDIDLGRFAPLYAQAKHQRITNEARRPIFTKGRLE